MIPEVAKLAGNKQNALLPHWLNEETIVSENKRATHAFDAKLASEQVWGKMFTFSRPQEQGLSSYTVISTVSFSFARSLAGLFRWSHGGRGFIFIISVTLIVFIASKPFVALWTITRNFSILYHFQEEW